MIGDINVRIIKRKDWPIDMAERTKTLGQFNSFVICLINPRLTKLFL